MPWQKCTCHLLCAKWNRTSHKVVQLPAGFTFLYKSLHFNHSSENFKAVISCGGVCFQYLCFVFLLVITIHEAMIKNMYTDPDWGLMTSRV